MLVVNGDSGEAIACILPPHVVTPELADALMGRATEVYRFDWLGLSHEMLVDPERPYEGGCAVVMLFTSHPPHDYYWRAPM